MVQWVISAHPQEPLGWVLDRIASTKEAFDE